MGLFAKYNALLQSRPLSTKIITSGFISAIGDLISQYTENHLKRKDDIKNNKTPSESTYNWKRTRTFFLWGSVVIAPFLHVAYAKVFPYLVPELTTVGAMKKLALD